MKNLSPINENKDVVTKEYVDPVKSLAAINRTTLGTQCKNLLKNNAVTKTVNGVTFTVNSDGSVTVKQTTTVPGNATIDVATNITLNPGTYILTGDDEIKKSGYGEIRFYINGTIYAANTAHTFDEEVTISAVRIFVWKGVNINGSKTIYPMLRYADITDNTYEPYKENVDERLTKNKSDIAVNKSTLGYQRKNILDEIGYLSSITSVTRGTKSISGNQITLTATADNCFTNPHTSSDGGYRIPVEPDTDYILSWESDNTYAGLVYVFMNGNTSNYKNANNKVSKYIKFTTNSDTTFITIRLAVATSGNSITYSNIMLRYADILDDTYEPYQPSVREQTGYSLSVSGKSTSAAISYNGVPTLICLTPNTADSTTGGLYMINSAGAVVKLIEKTGVVVAAASSSKTFTITNNTSTVIDVCISRCWGR